MEATDILMSEHRVIENVLTSLETAAEKLADGQAVRPGFFLDAAEFIKGFADGCHHKKEEGVLFPALAKFGIPVEGGPIGAMLADHEQGRAFTQAMRASATRLEAGDQSATQPLIDAAQGYAELLRQHIYKEDNILFRMANQVVPPAQQEQISQGFERVEHEETGEGVHEKYLALAQALQQEAGV